MRKRLFMVCMCASILVASNAIFANAAVDSVSATLSGSAVSAHSEIYNSNKNAKARTASDFAYGGVTVSSTCYQYSTVSHAISSSVKNASGSSNCSVTFSAATGNLIEQVVSNHTAKKGNQTWSAQTDVVR